LIESTAEVEKAELSATRSLDGETPFAEAGPPPRPPTRL